MFSCPNREFVLQKGLEPLMGILGLPNLPIDFPTHAACQAVSAVSKSILNLAHEPQVLKSGLSCLNDVLKNLEPLHKPLDPPGIVYFTFLIQSIFADLLKDSNKEIDYYEGMLFHIQSFVIILKRYGLLVSLI